MAVVRDDPRDMAELRVYSRDAFLCRAINPELPGETVARAAAFETLLQRVTSAQLPAPDCIITREYRLFADAVVSRW